MIGTRDPDPLAILWRHVDCARAELRAAGFEVIGTQSQVDRHASGDRSTLTLSLYVAHPEEADVPAVVQSSDAPGSAS
jgi:hypothetical protein